MVTDSQKDIIAQLEKEKKDKTPTDEKSFNYFSRNTWEQIKEKWTSSVEKTKRKRQEKEKFETQYDDLKVKYN